MYEPFIMHGKKTETWIMNCCGVCLEVLSKLLLCNEWLLWLIQNYKQISFMWCCQYKYQISMGRLVLLSDGNCSCFCLHFICSGGTDWLRVAYSVCPISGGAYLVFNLQTYKSHFLKHCVIFLIWYNRQRVHMAQLVEAMCYKPEGHGFDSRWYHWNFSLTLILLAALWPWGLLNL